MVLAVDIGNSTISVGVFGRTLDVRTIPTSPGRPSADYASIFRDAIDSAGVDKASTGIVISSVVPALTEDIILAARGLSGSEPMVVGPGTRGALRLDMRSPETLGPDRIASAVAASGMLGAPVAVLDFGTATTVNLIGRESGTGEAVFKGGAIMPGLQMMLNCLAGETARLPLVELRHGARSPGRDTEEGILSGVVMGTAGAVEKIIRAAEEHEGEPFKVAVTGGLMGYVLPFLWRVDLEEPHLTLMGLKLIYERNG